MTIKTDIITHQTTTTIIITINNTTIFISIINKKKTIKNQNFFPLTINYQKHTYTTNKIPNNFFKHKNHPSKNKTLTTHLINHPIHPLFPNTFKNKIQIITTIISINPNIQPNIITIINTSTTLTISNIPFNNPINTTHINHINNQLILNPNITKLTTSKLNLIITNTNNAILIIKSKTNNLTKKKILTTIIFNHNQQQIIINTINKFTTKITTPT